jgi:hypothetical protein
MRDEPELFLPNIPSRIATAGYPPDVGPIAEAMLMLQRTPGKRLGMDPDCGVMWVGDSSVDPARTEWYVPDLAAAIERVGAIIWAIESGAELVIRKP